MEDLSWKRKKYTNTLKLSSLPGCVSLVHPLPFHPGSVGLTDWTLPSSWKIHSSHFSLLRYSALVYKSIAVPNAKRKARSEIIMKLQQMDVYIQCTYFIAFAMLCSYNSIHQGEHQSERMQRFAAKHSAASYYSAVQSGYLCLSSE